jgi:tRNA A37 threonylcarbamoyladenosine dehydratase
MGAGNKLSAQHFVATDLAKTSGCSLARVMRRELKKRGIHHLKVVYSKEPAAPHRLTSEEVPFDEKKRAPIGSLSFVPGVAGLLLAEEVIKDLCQL